MTAQIVATKCRKSKHGTRCGLGTDLFTTGRIAKLCGVAPRTVSKWCDKGLLGHYRIPGTLDRRVTRAALLEFVARHGLTHALARIGPPAVLVVGQGDVVREAELAGTAGDVVAAADTWEAGRASSRPAAVAVVDALALGRGEAVALVRRLAALGPPPAVVGVTAEDDADPASWLAAGAEELVPRPLLPGSVAAAVARLYAAAVGGPTP